MLDTLITSKTRLKLLIKFFLNPESNGYLRSLESEFGESTNGIRIELNRFETAKLLTSKLIGNKKVYRANTKHPLFGQLQRIVHSYIGLDRIVDTVVENLGQIESVFLVGDFARGVDSSSIDLIIVGDINKKYLERIIKKAEPLISRSLNYNVVSSEDFGDTDALLLWETDVTDNPS